MTTLVIDGVTRSLAAKADGEQLWLHERDLAATGWELKDEGMCKGVICVPLDGQPDLVREDDVDIAGFSRYLGQAVAHDGDTWVIGESASERTEALRSLQAPDFALPDLAGKTHRLSDYRGRKIFLVSWASW